MKSIQILFFLYLSTITFAQNGSNNWCGTAPRMNDMWSNPEKTKVLLQDESTRQKEALLNQSLPKGIVLKIPVVFHILHNGGPENVSEEQIYNALAVMTRDFRAQNADTSEVIPLFKPIIGDAEIEFVLATKAPNGQCFRGYTRTQSPLTSQGDDGGAQVDAIRNGNDVYQGNWPSNQYLNVFVIDDAGGAGGYTNYPSNWNVGDMSNGIWILHTQFGEIGTSSPGGGRSMTHEVGHWLNLPHTWGSTNTPGEPGNCSTDDGVDDTPLCIGATAGCDLDQNDCGPIANIQNYMDYALNCQSMFTEEQALRMRTALQSSIGGRNNLWTTTNLALTGGDESVLCKADFSSDKNAVCAGEQIQFFDQSFNSVTGWNWSFPGGTPATSTDQNPIVTYSSPGVYGVTLIAQDGPNSETEVKSTFISVLSAPNQLPFLEGFENYTTLVGNNAWSVNNPGNNAKWEITTLGSHSGSKSVRLGNYNQPSGSFDDLTAASVDLSSSVASNTVLSFRYAYRKQNSLNNEYLRVFVSGDCGETWSLKKVIPGSVLSPIVATMSWAPSSIADWTTVHMTNLTPAMMTSSFRYKFEFQSNEGNNIYLDDINIYNGLPSDELVGVNELGFIMNDVQLYPNPSDEETFVRFQLDTPQNVEIILTDLSGKTISVKQINGSTGDNLVMLDVSDIAEGSYCIKIQNKNGNRILRFVKI